MIAVLFVAGGGTVLAAGTGGRHSAANHHPRLYAQLGTVPSARPEIAPAVELGILPAQPGALLTQPENLAAQPGPVPTQPATLPAQPGTLPTQPGTLPTQPGTLPTTCGQVIGQVTAGTQEGYRVVLGDVSVPPAYMGKTIATGSRPWRYWQKAGFQIRGGSLPVTISVPKDWQHRAAITWGADGMVSTLQISSCPASELWNDYVGGFYLRSPSACLPLQIRVGQRTATVWFGLGRYCEPSLSNSSVARR